MNTAQKGHKTKYPIIIVGNKRKRNRERERERDFRYGDGVRSNANSMLLKLNTYNTLRTTPLVYYTLVVN